MTIADRNTLKQVFFRCRTGVCLTKTNVGERIKQCGFNTTPPAEFDSGYEQRYTNYDRASKILARNAVGEKQDRTM
jgi:hypothetical protein